MGLRAGTTGESPTRDDDEAPGADRPRVCVSARRAGRSSLASLHDTVRSRRPLPSAAFVARCGRALSVTPYTTAEPGRPSSAHYTEVRPRLRTVRCCSTTSRAHLSSTSQRLLADCAQLEHIDGVKQANNDTRGWWRASTLYAGNDYVLGRVLDLGGHRALVGQPRRRQRSAPDGRRARALGADIDASLRTLFFPPSAVAPAAVTAKTALELAGPPSGAAPAALCPPCELRPTTACDSPASSVSALPGLRHQEALVLKDNMNNTTQHPAPHRPS